ncbi:SUMF1/EgtB/PvdO family nonheme iron enzyme [Nitrosomonas sp.]|uniref:SUMF1/EgtB/PvdO family nonheme iron enzyme n=1 Tax=Nitrosomonas sp. TaxID=42353 RepID=UPI0026301AC8|nr:SUMF1/EgtB/PvdO family nonheme iron enzyme [Nitrosomonas sp.]
MSKIFINYRRDDSAAHAGRLYDRLESHFGHGVIFMDIDQIEPGEDFIEVIQQKLEAVQVAVVLIGKHWLDITDAAGQRRLDNPDDFVRLEIATLLERKIRVIPVLVGGAVVPQSSQLPECLAPLARRHAYEISDLRFRADVDKFIQILEKVLSAKTASLPSVQSNLSGIERSIETRLSFEPEMVRIPPGKFLMGSHETEFGRDTREGPQHEVTIAYAFEIGKYVVTFDEYDAFVKATNRRLPDDVGWGRGRRPVINVSFEDAQHYVQWLSQQTGKQYRLPTEAEWEYAARAGTQTAYWWGSDIGKNNANCYACGSEWDYKQTAPVGSFKPNAFGLYDIAGNVWEWVEDCWHDNYLNAPTDGSAWKEANGGDCKRRVVRGGSWLNDPQFLRSASRVRYYTDVASDGLGFRIARALRL